MTKLKIGARCAALALLGLLATRALAQNNEYLIRDAKIVTVTGATIARGSVHIKDGKIVAVGERVTAPATAKVIDARGLSVYPGLIDSGTTLGLTEVSSVQETRDITELGDFSADAKAIVASIQTANSSP